MLFKLKTVCLGCLFVGTLLAQSLSRAGSYEDYFSAIGKDNDWVVSNLLSRGFDPKTPNEKGPQWAFYGLEQWRFEGGESVDPSQGHAHGRAQRA